MARGAITWSRKPPPSGSIHQLNYRYPFKKSNQIRPTYLDMYEAQELVSGTLFPTIPINLITVHVLNSDMNQTKWTR